MATCQHQVMQNGCAHDDPFSSHADLLKQLNQQVSASYGHLAECKLIFGVLLTLSFNATKHLRSPPVTAAGEWIFRSDPKLPGDEGMFLHGFLVTFTTPTTHLYGSCVQLRIIRIHILYTRT